MAILFVNNPCYIKTLAWHSKASDSEVAEFLLGLKQGPYSELFPGRSYSGETKAGLYGADILDWLKDLDLTDGGKLFGAQCQMPIQLELALLLAKSYPLGTVNTNDQRYLELIATLLAFSSRKLEEPRFEWSRERGQSLIKILELILYQWSLALTFAARWGSYQNEVQRFTQQGLSREALIEVLPVLKHLPFQTSVYANFKPKIHWP